MRTLFSKLLPLDLDRNAADPRRDGAPIRTVRKLMKDHWLYWTALAVVYVGVAVVTTSVFSNVVREMLVPPLSRVEVVAVAVVFLRFAFDSRFRSALDTVLRQHIAFQRRTPWRRQFFDPYWGVFSPYWGPKPYRVINVGATSEMVCAVVLASKGWGDLVFLAFATGFLSMMLGWLYVGLNTEPDNGLW
jgi:hypothetical protein